MGANVFGLGSQLDVLYTTLCFVGLIAFTIAFEVLDRYLRHRLAGSVYHDMLTKTYKELTILGFISFAVFMALNTNTIQPGKPFYAFEFSHIVIFFSALFFIIQSIMMMACSKSLKREIDYICSEPIPTILSNYHNLGYRRFTSWFHTRKYSYNNTRYHMELKLLQHFFLDMYALDGFDFASYLHTCFDEQFLELCEVDPSSWAFFIVLLVANLVRYYSVDTSITLSTLLSFCAVSWLLLGVCVWLFFAVRNVELKLLSVAGCDDTFEYESKLEVIQDKIIGFNKKLLSLSSDDAEIVRIKREKEAEMRESLKRRTSVYREQEVERQQLEEIKVEEERANVGRAIRTTVRATLNGKLIKGVVGRLGVGASSSGAQISPEGGSRSPDFLSSPLSAIVRSRSLGKTIGQEGGLEPKLPDWLKDDRSLAASEFFKGLEHVDAIAEFEKKHHVTRHLHTEADLGQGEGEGGRNGDEHDDDEHDDSGDDDVEELDAPNGGVRGSGRYDAATTKRASPPSSDGSRKAPVSPPSSSSGVGVVDDFDVAPRALRQTAGASLKHLGRERSVKSGKHSEGGKHGASVQEKPRASRGTMGKAEGAHSAGGGGAESHDAVESAVAALRSKGSQSKLESMYNRNEGIDLAVIYPFKNKHILKRVLDILLLINCLYLAMVASNFAIVNVKDGYAKFGGFFWGHVVFDVLMIGPSLAQIPIIYMIVRTNNIISAIAELDIEIVSEVIENAEEMAELEFEVFQIIRERLESIGAEKQFLKKIFSSIDVDGNGTLDFDELRLALVKMGVHLSKAKYKSLFRILDQSKTGSISFPEFHALIFPEDDVRVKVRSDEIAMKSHEKKKNLFLAKEQANYDNTFEGMLQSGAKGMQQAELEAASRARKEGALQTKMELSVSKEREKIRKISSARLSTNKGDMKGRGHFEVVGDSSISTLKGPPRTNPVIEESVTRSPVSNDPFEIL